MLRRSSSALSLVLLAACASAPRPTVVAPTAAPLPRTATIIPIPASVRAAAADSFAITDSTRIVIPSVASIEVERVALQLSALLAPAANGGVTRLATGESAPPRSIFLALATDTLGDEGYTLIAGRDGVLLRSSAPAGLFAAVQTLRQLLPEGVEHHAAVARHLVVPGVRIDDRPRYAWRGAMLDVARHFLPPDDVKRFIDYMAAYKLNRLHLHLSDDQGWRIEIKSWPNLTANGGRTEVGGGYGGFYTQAEYADIVSYAAERYVTIVPEIDMPSHINAALASYPELNCDDKTPPLYTGTRVGFSLICVTRGGVYTFIDDVVREIGAMTPGPYFHIGGDEVEKLDHAGYIAFVERVEGIVRRHGKRTVGWAEIAAATLSPETIAQHWRPMRTTAIDSSAVHAARGGQIILSPATRTYLDMKYDSSTVLGYTWAAIFDVKESYDWNPDSFLPGVTGRAVLGVEGPLWSETIERRSEYEYLAFPRLIALAEVGWSRQADRTWDDFRVRLGNHARRLSALGINFHRSSQVPWRP